MAGHNLEGRIMTTTTRRDGLDDPRSPNCRMLGWDDIERACEDSDVVRSYSRDGGAMTITWCDGSDESFVEPGDAWAAIEAMSRS